LPLAIASMSSSTTSAMYSARTCKARLLDEARADGVLAQGAK
jgi:hypothetical protein